MTQENPNQPPSGFCPAWLIAVMLAAATIFLYWPATRCDFVNYDDPIYFSQNPHVLAGLTLANVPWAFTTGLMGNWNPLTWLSLMLDASLFGTGPAGVHFTNLLLHALNSALLFWLLWRLTGARWRSALVAAGFAWHPLHVESVAWIAERKDVLSTFFGFLALLFYVRYAQLRRPDPAAPPVRKSRTHYWLAWFCLALGLMSKPMLVSWPLVFLLLDFWPPARWPAAGLRQLVTEKIPFVALAAAQCLVTFLIQKKVGAMTNAIVLPFGARAENAVISCCRYLGKMFWPVKLAAYYPLHRYWPAGEVVLAGLLLAGVSALAIRQYRRHPCLLLGWLWFILTLLPVIGLVQVGSQAIADRYTYIPSVGVLIMLVWGAAELAPPWRGLKPVGALTAVMALLCCLAITRRQISYWRDSESLFGHDLAVTEKSPIPMVGLGVALINSHRLDEALALFQEASQMDPKNADAHLSLGMALALKGRPAEAISQYEAALCLVPGNVTVQTNLDTLLAVEDRTNSTLRELRAATRRQPDAAPTHVNLANAYLQAGRTFEAMKEFQAALQLQPGNAQTHHDLASLFARVGRTDDAITQFQEVIRLQPDNADAHNDLGAILNRAYQTDAAIAQFQEVLRLQPGHVEAHYNLAGIFFKAGRMGEAIQEYQTVLRLQPGFAPAHYFLGLALARIERLDEAIVQFQAAIRLKPADAFAHNELGLAFAAQGRTDEAAGEFQTALRLKPDYTGAQDNLARLPAGKNPAH